MIIIIIILFHALIGIGVCGEAIEVKDGLVSVLDGFKCNISVNNIEMVSDYTGVMDGLYFGLIRYNCGNISGILISKSKCVDYSAIITNL